jgi:hypothetical protein
MLSNSQRNTDRGMDSAPLSNEGDAQSGGD